MASSDKDGAIVSAVLALGASLGLEVIAEGVENINHRRLLGEAGCTLFQGYLFSRPVPPAEFGALILDSSDEELHRQGKMLARPTPPGVAGHDSRCRFPFKLSL